jgi:hypothetical protein
VIAARTTDARGLAQQVGRRRGLEDEGEAAILEDGDLRGDDLARLRRGALVVGLGELDDVDAVRAQRGPDRRRSGRLARWGLDLHDRAYFLCHLILRGPNGAVRAPPSLISGDGQSRSHRSI